MILAGVPFYLYFAAKRSAGAWMIHGSLFSTLASLSYR